MSNIFYSIRQFVNDEQIGVCAMADEDRAKRMLQGFKERYVNDIIEKLCVSKKDLKDESTNNLVSINYGDWTHRAILVRETKPIKSIPCHCNAGLEFVEEIPTVKKRIVRNGTFVTCLVKCTKCNIKFRKLIRESKLDYFKSDVYNLKKYIV